MRYNTMIVMLFRPSPQVPEPSTRAARHCFEACKFNMHVQRQQITAKTIDLTWVFVQSLFMAVNGMLWTLSHHEVRREHPKAEVDSYLETALEAIYLASMKWPGVESALELYIVLVEVCRKAYDGDAEATYSIVSSQVKAEIRSPPSTGTGSALSSPSSAGASNLHDNTRPQPTRDSHKKQNFQAITSASTAAPQIAPSRSNDPFQATQSATTLSYPHVSDMGSATHAFDPNTLNNPLPPPLNYGYVYNLVENISGQNVFSNVFEEPFAHAFNAGFAPPGPMDGLDLELQSELMGNFEADPRIQQDVGEISPTQVLSQMGALG